MARQRRSSEGPDPARSHRPGRRAARLWQRHWLWNAARVGLAVSLPVPVAILAARFVPGLFLAYPLVLLPLLLAGPLAGAGLSLGRAALAALLAGTVSAVVAATSLAVGVKLTGAWYWTLTSAASAPPMPPLPRIAVLPTEWLSWAQQDVLFFQPLLALVLGLTVGLLAPSATRAVERLVRWLPRSLAGRLRLAFATLVLSTLAVGMAGFSTIEDMHLRVHRLQLHASWQRELGVARTLLDTDLIANVGQLTDAERAEQEARAQQIEAIYQRLGSAAPWPGVSVGREDIATLVRRYQPLLEEARAAHQAYRASPGNRASLREAIVSLGLLHHTVELDLADVLAASDLSHHERLIGVMGLVALVAGLGLWTGDRVMQAIGGPLATLGAHVQRVAQGNFQHRVREQGPDELRHLGEAVNQMTADLARLYAAERERRALAEGIATHERELSAAKEFWTNTLVHDLKSPLGLIAGWAELLESGRYGCLAAGQSDAVRQIRLAAIALDDLVADINDSFRLQAQALPIHRTVVTPWELFRSTAEKYHGLDRAAPDVRIMHGVGPFVADARLVSRVLHNLIANAYRHAGSQARVVLSAQPVGGGVRIAVDDDGPGIPAGEQERVFERFIQGRGAAQGSGLGLAFCKLVIEQLDGRIWAEASPLGGARIVFELPAVRSEVPGLGARAALAPDARVAPAARVA